MRIISLANANSSVITVTGTATKILTLINTAGGVTHSFPSGMDSVDLYVEGEDIRILFDGNTPTTTKGLLLKKGGIYHFRKVPLDEVRVIAVSGTVSCGVQVGFSDPEEFSDIENGTVVSSGGVVSNSPDSGAPVKVGLVYNATPPTGDDGDRGDMQGDENFNLKTTLATALDKTNDSITNYPVGCNMTVVDLATDADVVVSATPAVLVGIYVNTVFSAHAVNILDGAVTKLILPASLAAGTEKDMRRATFATSLIVNSDDAATGSLVIFWRPL